MAKGNILHKLFASGPLILLYYLSISEIDTNLEKLFEVFSLNLQIIIIYFWIIKRPNLMGPGHIFLAGLNQRCSDGISIRYKLIILPSSMFCR